MNKSKLHLRNHLRLRRLLPVCLMFTALAGAMPARLAAGLITPAGLTAGEQFRYVFVTASTSRIDKDLAGDNSFVTADANATGSLLAPLNSSWLAFAYINGTPATTNIGNFNVPLYTPDGVLVAANENALFNTANTQLDAPIDITPLGTTKSTRVWTGMNADGTPVGIGLADQFQGIFGDNTRTDGGYLNAGNAAWYTLYGFYGISANTFTVDSTGSVVSSTPEPSTYLLMAGALMSLVVVAKRKKSYC